MSKLTRTPSPGPGLGLGSEAIRSDIEMRGCAVDKRGYVFVHHVIELV
jgi:hypothetical protein